MQTRTPVNAPRRALLVAAQKARGTTLSINSALRTLPQQFLLYRWYQTGRCGIGLAASPGTSNHEGGIAVDIDDSAGWRASMTAKDFRWLGASDPVHYDFIGGGTVDLRGLSVKAFQRLWNRNHPGETIPEDGAYGAATADKLARSPVGGFAKGASCTNSKPDAGAPAKGDGGGDPPMGDVPVVPDADEPSSDARPVAAPAPSAGPALAPSPAPAEGGGCAARPARERDGALAFVAIAAALAWARRRARRAQRAGATSSTSHVT
jgi:hypothetical protein